MKQQTEKTLLESYMSNIKDLDESDMDQDGYYSLVVENESIVWFFNLEGKSKKIDNFMKRIELGVRSIEDDI